MSFNNHLCKAIYKLVLPQRDSQLNVDGVNVELFDIYTDPFITPQSTYYQFVPTLLVLQCFVNSFNNVAHSRSCLFVCVLSCELESCQLISFEKRIGKKKKCTIIKRLIKNYVCNEPNQSVSPKGFNVAKAQLTKNQDFQKLFFTTLNNLFGATVEQLLIVL